MDQNIWTVISYIAGLLTAFIGSAAGAYFTNRYTRSQERRRKEVEVIEKIYTYAIDVRRIIDPALVAASAPYTAIQSTWVDPMIGIVTLTNLYLPSLEPMVKELNDSIKRLEDVFAHASYEKNGYGSATKRVLPANFEQEVESFRTSFAKLREALEEFSKKQQ